MVFECGGGGFTLRLDIVFRKNSILRVLMLFGVVFVVIFMFSLES